MAEASREYREFIAEVVGELAMGAAHLGNYQAAAPLFSEALALTPDAPELLLDDAQAALSHGDFQQARSRAQLVLANDASGAHPVDKQTAALAHQIAGRALMKMYQDKEARKELEAAVALNPNFQNGYALAVVCLDMGDQKCARQLFTEMEASFGDTALIHLEFGTAYGESDFPFQAIAEFKRAIAENDRLPEAHYSLAAAYLASQEAANVPKAEAELQQELQISPDDFLTYAALGHIEFMQHRYAEAERDLKHAITLNPNNPDAYLYLGQLYYETNDAANAEAALRQAIQHTTDISRNHYQIQKAHYLLGRLLARSGHDAEAQAEMRIVQQLMQQALNRDKDRLSGKVPRVGTMGSSTSDTIAMASLNDDGRQTSETKSTHELETFRNQIAAPVADSYNNLGAIAASSKDYATALNYFQRASQWNPQLPGLDYNWGHAAFMSSRFQDAVLPLTRYLHAHPGDSSIRPALAISLFMTGDYNGVVQTLQPVLSTIDQIPQVEYVYADSLVKTGQRPAGIARLLALEKQHPEISDVHRALGEAYAQGRRPDLSSAVEELNAAVRLNPMDAQTHFDLGKVNLQQGNVQAAITELETAVQLKPSDCSLHSELALAYRQSLRPQDAEREEKYCEQHASTRSRPQLP
ncbi:MAG TPA: tetratricopeptide repeat protein [Acidobacteriaceae bacterium]|nr:tetratricopeptide repeat protein [Acidobacteriaceae bacterium]